jgi:hypothetical protein
VILHSISIIKLYIDLQLLRVTSIYFSNVLMRMLFSFFRFCVFHPNLLKNTPCVVSYIDMKCNNKRCVMYLTAVKICAIGMLFYHNALNLLYVLESACVFLILFELQKIHRRCSFQIVLKGCIFL